MCPSVSLVGALYAYGIAVENGWAPEANVRDNKHVQLVMQRTGMGVTDTLCVSKNPFFLKLFQAL